MKKNVTKGLFYSAVATLTLSSCLGDVSNEISGGDAFATVIKTTISGQKTFLVDGFAYCHATEVSAKDYNPGDRVLLNQYTLNYDNQLATAKGSKDAPLEMTNVVSTNITGMWKGIGMAPEGEVSDTVSQALYPVYTEVSDINKYYMTFQTAVKDGKSVTDANLYYDSFVRNDSMFVNFEVRFDIVDVQNASASRYYKSFNVPRLPEKCLVTVTIPTLNGYQYANPTDPKWDNTKKCYTYSFERSSTEE